MADQTPTNHDPAGIEREQVQRFAQQATAVKGEAVRHCLSVLAPSVPRSSQDYHELLLQLEEVLAREIGQAGGASAQSPPSSQPPQPAQPVPSSESPQDEPPPPDEQA